MYHFYGTQCIINVHGFLAVVEIPSSEKSAKSETSIFGLRFLRFFKCHFKLKKSRYFGFAINVKGMCYAQVRESLYTDNRAS